MLGDFPVLNAENINDVKVELIPRGGIAQPFTLVGGGGSGIHHDDIAFGDYFFNGIAEIRQAFEYPLEKLLESCFALRRILVMLDIVVFHYLVEFAEIMLLKYSFTERFNKLFIFIDIGHRKLTSLLIHNN